MAQVHLVNDEKFIKPFIKRVLKVCPTAKFVVFGKPGPFKFIEGMPNVQHSSTWNEKVNSEVFIHLLTFQKINWVGQFAPEAKVNWIYYGSDLYELLSVFKRYGMIEAEDRSRGLLSQVSGRTFYQRLQRWIKLRAYYPHFKKFIAKRLDHFCFWNPGDFELLRRYFPTRATLKFFQYGAFNSQDIELVANAQKTTSNGHLPRILLNHSGSQSGNHIHIMKKLRGLDSKMEIIAPLSYGDTAQIQRVKTVGPKLLGSNFLPILDFLDRTAYYELLCSIDIAVFGHVRQEAGNTLFISLLAGTKVFVHPKSVLIPYLKSQGFLYFTTDILGSDNWLKPLSEADKAHNKKQALAHFAEEKIEQAYLSNFQCVAP